MKFKWYIMELFDRIVTGTNNEEVAVGYGTSEDFIVINTEGTVLDMDGNLSDIRDVENVNPAI